MIDLALSVLCSTLIFVIFKLFEVYQVQTLYAIIVNYIVAFLTGFILDQNSGSLIDTYKETWFMASLFLGIFFILVFNIMARSAQVNGVGVTSVATKMSLVIPVIFAVVVYGDRLSTFQDIGILMALGAVYLSAIGQKKGELVSRKLWLPILVFLGSGIIDTSIKYFQDQYLDDGSFAIFSSTVFGAAAISGMFFIILSKKGNGLKVNFKNVLGGVCLGVPNFFSIFFLLRALNQPRMNSSAIFTINNVSIVLFSTIFGLLLFKEKLSKQNWLGVIMAIISIVLVAMF